jgi:hypothetical protein
MTQAVTLVTRAPSQLRRVTPVSEAPQPQLRFQQRNSRAWRFRLELALPGEGQSRLGRILDVQA